MMDMEILRAKTLSELAEASRILTGLDAAGLAAGFAVRGVKSPCYMVTSAEAGEGKTLAVAGIAMAAARRGGRRVLAVDLNWYRPGLHRCFGLERAWSMGQRKREGDAAAYVVPSGVEGLDVLTAPADGGLEKRHTTEVSGRAADLLGELREGYDMVFVDTASVFPPNRNMLDPVFIGRACDAAVMIVLANVTARQQVKRGRMLLESAGVPVHGIVLNNWKNTIC